LFAGIHLASRHGNKRFWIVMFKRIPKWLLAGTPIALLFAAEWSVYVGYVRPVAKAATPMGMQADAGRRISTAGPSLSASDALVFGDRLNQQRGAVDACGGNHSPNRETRNDDKLSSNDPTSGARNINQCIASGPRRSL
jgi:hypothetical protein